MSLTSVFTPALGRNVQLRKKGSDRQVWADTFTGLYHVPPESMPAPQTVLDLGANIGLTAAHYRALWPDAEVVAVEMDEESAELARLNAPGAKVRVEAVAGRGGWGSYNPDLRSEAFSFVPWEDVGRRVQARQLRKIILRAFGARVIDFVKMDVEGAEWGILHERSWVGLVRYLLIELHPDDDHPDDSDQLVDLAVAELEACGMSARRHTTHPRAVWAAAP